MSFSLEEHKKLNYDNPNSFVEHTRLEETVEVKSTKVVIFEGILIFENKEVSDLMDIKVFVDTDGDVRIIRRLLRDVQERERDLEFVANQYLSIVKPMHEKFVEPSKKRANIIITEGGENIVALSMLLEKIRNFINEN